MRVRRIAPAMRLCFLVSCMGINPSPANIHRRPVTITAGIHPSAHAAQCRRTHDEEPAMRDIDHQLLDAAQLGDLEQAQGAQA